MSEALPDTVPYNQRTAIYYSMIDDAIKEFIENDIEKELKNEKKVELYDNVIKHVSDQWKKERNRPMNNYEIQGIIFGIKLILSFSMDEVLQNDKTLDRTFTLLQGMAVNEYRRSKDVQDKLKDVV